MVPRFQVGVKSKAGRASMTGVRSSRGWPHQRTAMLLPLRGAVVYSRVATSMPDAIPDRSWQVSRAALLAPAVAGAVLVALLGGAEIASRCTAVRAALHAPSVGSPSRRFELQLDSLQRYAASASPDCIVLGNSAALMGIDPDALNAGYRTRTDNGLRCFNFGVAGLTASAAAAVAPMLIDRYHPWLLLYVVSPRDLGESVDGPLLANMSWLQYRHGKFSLSGWLTEHSAAFRYWLLYRQWLDPLRWPAAASPAGTTPAGYFPVETRLPLSPELWTFTQQSYARIASQPLSQPEFDGFTGVLEVAGKGAQVVVIEAPMHPRLGRWARHSSRFHDEAIAGMRRATRQRRVTFWHAPVWRIIPSDGWADFFHLNPRGAARFSDWLGGRIALAVQAGRLRRCTHTAYQLHPVTAAVRSEFALRCPAGRRGFP